MANRTKKTKKQNKKTAVIDLTNGKEDQIVFLLHGLGRNNFNLHSFGTYLHQQGYRVIIPNYPSQKKSIHQCGNFIADFLSTQNIGHYKKVHFVGQSMGGAVVRSLLERHGKPDNMGRVVMLVPPFGGSEVADWFKKHPALKRPYKWLKGPAGQELGTAKDGIRSLYSKPIDYDLGIIAAILPDDYKTFFKPLFMPGPEIINGANDGLVSVNSTKVSGMKDHTVITAEHTDVEVNEEAWEQTAYFLKKGKFQP